MIKRMVWGKNTPTAEKELSKPKPTPTRDVKFGAVVDELKELFRSVENIKGLLTPIA